MGLGPTRADQGPVRPCPRSDKWAGCRPHHKRARSPNLPLPLPLPGVGGRRGSPGVVEEVPGKRVATRVHIAARPRAVKYVEREKGSETGDHKKAANHARPHDFRRCRFRTLATGRDMATHGATPRWATAGKPSVYASPSLGTGPTPTGSFAEGCLTALPGSIVKSKCYGTSRRRS
jgi:hypothetical protein